MTNGSKIYENVGRQFNKAADLMNLDPDVRKILEKPMNGLCAKRRSSSARLMH